MDLFKHANSTDFLEGKGKALREELVTHDSIQGPSDEHVTTTVSDERNGAGTAVTKKLSMEPME